MNRAYCVVFGLLAALLPAQGRHPSLRLYGDMIGTTTYLVDTNGRTVHTWTSNRRPGLSVYMLDDGTLLRTIDIGGGPSGTQGGAGGELQRLALDGTLLWNFRYGGNGVWAHHDIEPLPNGNVLMIAWEDKSRAEAIAAGRNPSWVSNVFRPNHIVEVQPTGPTTGDIVWEWHLFDPNDLWADSKTLSLTPGGTVGFDMIAGSAHAGEAYLLLGSASGTSPGVVFNGQLLPLNPDGYFNAMLSQPNQFPFGETLGVLDANGRASASFTLPPGLTVLAGLRFDHAYITFDPISGQVTRTSKAVPLDLVQ